MRRWRSVAADRELAFHGRSIDDIRSRFSELYPELVNGRPGQTSPLPEPSDQATAFERGLHNGFGTLGVSRLRAQRISAATNSSPSVPSPSVAPSDGTSGAGGIVHPPAQEVGVPAFGPGTYTPEGVVGQDLGFPSPITANSPGVRLPTPPFTASELAETLQLFTPPSPFSVHGHYDGQGQVAEAPPVA